MKSMICTSLAKSSSSSSHKTNLDRPTKATYPKLLHRTSPTATNVHTMSPPPSPPPSTINWPAFLDEDNDNDENYSTAHQPAAASSSSSTSHQAAVGPPAPRPAPPTELKFFMISDPAEARTPGNKKLVRSHVARTSHAKSRHARGRREDKTARCSPGPGLRRATTPLRGQPLVVVDSMECFQHDGEGQLVTDAIGTTLGSSVLSSSLVPSPYSSTSLLETPQRSLLGVPGQQCLTAEPLGQWEQYLLDYCKFVLPKRLILPDFHIIAATNKQIYSPQAPDYPQISTSSSPSGTTHATTHDTPSTSTPSAAACTRCSPFARRTPACARPST